MMEIKPKRGLILMNLGSPASVAVNDVRKYLVEFLMDERVIDQPYLLRLLLVKGIISPFRASKSAEAYRTVWTKDGSPLIVNTKELQISLSEKINLPIEIAMRYGTPSMKTAFDKILASSPGLEEVVLLPLYPHYAMSSYETAVVHAKEEYSKGNYPFKISFIEPFYKDTAYIAALAESIKPYLNKEGHLLFSYHSIPERHIHKSDITKNHCLNTLDCCTSASPAHQYCYRHQCFVTTQLVAEYLHLTKQQYSISFQSKLGRAKWLTPSTTQRMAELPTEGIKNLLVVCPAFVSDCLETLEEVAIREKENFIAAGGLSFTFIPCINNQPKWVEAIVGWLNN